MDDIVDFTHEMHRVYEQRCKYTIKITAFLVRPIGKRKVTFLLSWRGYGISVHMKLAYMTLDLATITMY
jgi:hypothetical protein